MFGVAFTPTDNGGIMPTISLMSFLKILTKGSPQKAQEYGKYLKPGGYQFYWMLKDSARSFTIGGKPYTEAAKPIQETVGRDVERECNLAALKALQSWQKKYQPDSYFTVPSGASTTPGGFVTVKLEPEFGIVKAGHRRIVQLWYSKNTTLAKQSVILGNYLIQKHLCVGEFVDCKAGILDLRKKELLLADTGSPQVMEMMIASEFAWIDSYFKSQEDAAKVA
jgi:hypothetical protein